ncbi:MAG TPA: hypothetical protein VKA82_02880 [Rubrobacter sp.]|nr:hypothetical protein [Rubrobacter sp.]
MVSVTVVFTNGTVVEFAAQQFDVNLEGERGNVNKYPYKDAEGKDSSIHLLSAEVAGVFVTTDVDVITVRIPLHT